MEKVVAVFEPGPLALAYTQQKWGFFTVYETLPWVSLMSQYKKVVRDSKVIG